jgi:hypothetical protein
MLRKLRGKFFSSLSNTIFKYDSLMGSYGITSIYGIYRMYMCPIQSESRV